jgi:hypothetical protein
MKLKKINHISVKTCSRSRERLYYKSKVGVERVESFRYRERKRRNLQNIDRRCLASMAVRLYSSTDFALPAFFVLRCPFPGGQRASGKEIQWPASLSHSLSLPCCL